MNSVTPLYQRLLVVILWILVISLATHFLHDLQPGHLDFQGTATASHICQMAIHSGILGGSIPGVTQVFLIFSVVIFSQVFHPSDSRSVPLPPPILARIG